MADNTASSGALRWIKELNNEYIMDRILNGISLLVLSLLLLTACSDRRRAQSIDPTIEPTRVVVRILDLDIALSEIPTSTTVEITPEVTPPTISIGAETTPSVTFASEPSSNKTRTPENPATPSCSNQAEFIGHLNISNNTALESAQFFTKIWQVKNSGTCTWTVDYSLVFFAGESMNSPESVNLPKNVMPGETIDLSVNLLAPTSPNSHTGYWVLRDTAGNLFGVGEKNDQPISVTIFVKPTPKPPPS